jgi:hypothetical protein
MTALNATDIRPVSGPADAIADGLFAHDIYVIEPASEYRDFLKIHNAQGALAEIAVSDDGKLTWEYRPFAGRPNSPQLTVAIVLALLDPDSRTSAASLSVAQIPAPTLKDLLDRAASDHGLTADLLVCQRDAINPEITYAEISVASPARPQRGTVVTAEDGGIWWTCHLRDQPAGTGGLPAADIADAIARALAAAGCLITCPAQTRG